MTQVDILIRGARSAIGTGGPVAALVRGGRIVACGPEAEVAPLAGNDARVIEAKGATLLAGFVESHAHVFTGGAVLDQLNLSAVTGEGALAAAVGAFAAARPAPGLLCAYGVNYTILGEDRRPTRHDLDRILPDRPFYMAATDYHCAWANTAALRLAGVLAGAEAGPGAEVVMGPDGQATGELREFGAMALVKRLAPSGGREELGLSGKEPGAVTEAERAADRALIRRALDHCAAHGITTVVNMDGNLYQAGLLEEMDRAGDLPIRVSLPMTLTEAQGEDHRRALLERAMTPPTGRLSFGRVKMFMDGVFDTWTAHLVGDYPDRPGFSGEPLFSEECFRAVCVEADRRGLQIAVHAVGDGAVRRVLDGYAAARAANGRRDARHRIEHIDTIHPDDLPRLADLGVVASMQPVHPPGSAGLPLEPTISLMGRARWPHAFAWAAIRDRGVPVAFGTDWPVSPLDPLHAIGCAMTRQPWAADMPDQRLSLAECLAAYSAAGAHAAFGDGQYGRLSPGLAADLVLVEGPIGQMDEARPLARVVLTLAAGRVVHAADGWGTDEYA
ncbi:MAG: amidohydrolase [Proteobacteria bacterium]|nr:amidohydrolase [Pseudomonadota bacterium]MBS0572980.1 amidohydrolase [Pseudomonadota bacterium]